VYEPVGAAYYYAQRLKSDALVLVCDFGGGTSDFSLLRFKRRGSGVAVTDDITAAEVTAERELR
jgi:hypothetical chaperone protein